MFNLQLSRALQKITHSTKKKSFSTCKKEQSFISAQTGDTLTKTFLHLLVKRDGGLLLTPPLLGGGRDRKDQLTAGRLCSLSPRAESTACHIVGSSKPQCGGGGVGFGGGGWGQDADGWESLSGLSEEVW